MIGEWGIVSSGCRSEIEILLSETISEVTGRWGDNETGEEESSIL